MDILLASLVIFLVLGIPVAYSLGLSAFSYFVISHPELLQILPQRFLSGLNVYVLIALPLFILMGLLMNKSGITARLIDFSLLFVGRFRGGLGLVNVFASMIFGGISGSSASDTASIGAVLIPEMERRGYPPRFAAGCYRIDKTNNFTKDFDGNLFFSLVPSFLLFKAQTKQTAHEALYSSCR